MEAIYYFTGSGQKPVKKFLEKELNRDEEAEVRAAITDLEIQGHKARRPLSDHVKGKIREIRARLKKNRYRVLYYFCYKKYIVLLHGIKKKTSEIPKKDIKAAETRMKDFEKRIKQKRIEIK